ncbi:hypothetical protein CSUI_010690, partial [Cystoisospora suis]
MNGRRHLRLVVGVVSRHVVKRRARSFSRSDFDVDFLARIFLFFIDLFVSPSLKNTRHVSR